MKKTQHFCGNDQFLGVLRSLILREGIEFAILYSAKKGILDIKEQEPQTFTEKDCIKSTERFHVTSLVSRTRLV